MSVWGVRGPVQFALPEPIRNVGAVIRHYPLQRTECDVVPYSRTLLAFLKRCAVLEVRTFGARLTLRALPAGRAFIANVQPASDVSCRFAGTAHGSKPGGSSKFFASFLEKNDVLPALLGTKP